MPILDRDLVCGSVIHTHCHTPIRRGD